MKMRERIRESIASVLRQFRFPGRGLVVEALEALLGENPGTFIVPLHHGGQLIVDGVTDKPLFYTGGHEWHVLDFLVRNTKEGHTIVDVGANIGSYAIPLALRAGVGGRVYAIEAFKPNYEILVKNVQLNSLSNLIAVFAAIADTTGTLQVPEVKERRTDMGNYSLASYSPTQVRIPSWTLDNFADKYEIRMIDLLKIDIEGSEVLALKGAHRLFSAGRVGIVCCEFNPLWLSKMGSSADELYGLFKEYMLRAFLLTRFSTLKPIDRNFIRHATRSFDCVLLP